MVEVARDERLVRDLLACRLARLGLERSELGAQELPPPRILDLRGQALQEGQLRPR